MKKLLLLTLFIGIGVVLMPNVAEAATIEDCEIVIKEFRLTAEDTSPLMPPVPLEEPSILLVIECEVSERVPTASGGTTIVSDEVLTDLTIRGQDLADFQKEFAKLIAAGVELPEPQLELEPEDGLDPIETSDDDELNDDDDGGVTPDG